MSYKKALKKLESLPPGERQLAAGQFVWDVKKGKSHCGCATGKLLTEKQRARMFRHENNVGGGVSTLALFLKFDRWSDEPTPLAGLTSSEIGGLIAANDHSPPGSVYAANRNDYATRRARYKAVIAWLREKVAEEAQKAAA